MTDEQHIIERVKVDVEVETIELAERIKSEINDFIHNEVLSIVESYFADLNVPDELKDKVIQLDSVNLTFETASWNPNSVGLKNQLRDEVEKQMNPIIADLKEAMVKDELSVSSGFNPIREKEANVYSKEERIIKSLFYFLEFGSLPWWVKSVEESRELFSEVSLVPALRAYPDFARKEWRKVRSNEQVLTRLVRQFSVSVVSEFIQLEGSSEVSKREEVRSFVQQELSVLPKRLVQNVLKLILDLTETNVRSKVFTKTAKKSLFRHIHHEFFQADLANGKLVATITSSYALLRVLYVLNGKSTEMRTLKGTFKEVLKEELPEEAFASVARQKVIQQLFDFDIQTDQSKGLKNNGRELGSSAEGMESKFEETIKGIHSSEAVENDTLGQNDEAKSSQEVKVNGEIASSESDNEPESSADSNLDQLKNDEGKVEVLDGSTEISKEAIDDKYSEVKSSAESNSQAEAAEINRTTEEVSNQNKSSRTEENTPNNEAKREQKTADKSETEKGVEKDEDQLTEEAVNSSQAMDQHQSEDKPDTLGRQNGSLNEKDKSDEKVNATEEKDPDVQSKEKRVEQQNHQRSTEMKEAGAGDDVLNQILQKEKDAEQHKRRRTEKMPNELFVPNAGVVLLNPFIPALFRKLELIGEDGKLVDPDVSAALLHYAATGREGDYEFEMTFEKYLCGIPPTIPMSREIELSQAQKNEVDVLLNSVLEHWTTLKSKSTELLQNEFLSRSGKLMVEKTNHRLIIERKTFDLLLDKLPWSYSLVKFSWKKELLFVEW